MNKYISVLLASIFFCVNAYSADDINVEALLNKCFDSTNNALKATVFGNVSGDTITALNISADTITADTVGINYSGGTIRSTTITADTNGTGVATTTGKQFTFNPFADTVDYVFKSKNSATALVVNSDATAANEYIQLGVRHDWSTGNVWYLDVGDDINTFIASASCTAGDTIQLGAGTYTLTAAPITIGKKVHLKGMGRGITTLTTAALATGASITNTASGTLITDMTIQQTGALTGSRSMIDAQENMLICKVAFSDTSTNGSGTNNSIAVRASTGISKTIEMRDCSYSSSGAARWRAFIYPSVASTVNAYNCSGTETGATLAGYANTLAYSSSGTINLYDCNLASANNTTSGVIMTEGGIINVYGGFINGSGATAFDVKNISGTLTLYDTTLVNNTTSGTITYGGTVVSKNISGDRVKIGTAIMTADSTAPAGVVGRIRVVTQDGAAPCFIQIFAN